MLEKLLNQRLVLLSIILIMSCNDVKNSKKKVDAKSIVRDENSINPKTEKLKKYPKKDTIFLGFRLGMSKSEFDSHLKELIKKGKLKYSNNSILYSLNFKKQVLENEDKFLDDLSQMITNAKEGVEPKEEVTELSYDGILKPKFGDKKLYELTLTFKNTTNLRSQFALPYILENLIKEYGCCENNEMADYSCFNKKKDSKGAYLAVNIGKMNTYERIVYPKKEIYKTLPKNDIYKSLVDNKVKNKSLYWWSFPNGFNISVRGEYDLPRLLNSRKIAITEKEVTLTYLSYKDRESYLNNQEAKINMDNKNSASDF